MSGLKCQPGPHTLSGQGASVPPTPVRGAALHRPAQRSWGVLLEHVAEQEPWNRNHCSAATSILLIGKLITFGLYEVYGSGFVVTPPDAPVTPPSEI